MQRWLGMRMELAGMVGNEINLCSCAEIQAEI
jgi:hypothetical protein